MKHLNLIALVVLLTACGKSEVPVETETKTAVAPLPQTDPSLLEYSTIFDDHAVAYGVKATAVPMIFGTEETSVFGTCHKVENGAYVVINKETWDDLNGPDAGYKVSLVFHLQGLCVFNFTAVPDDGVAGGEIMEETLNFPTYNAVHDFWTYAQRK